MSTTEHPHDGAQLFQAGVPLDRAEAVVVMLHGRGGSARDMLQLAGELGGESVCFVAPQAFSNTWYPQSFLADFDTNAPYLSSAHRLIEDLLDAIGSHGVPRSRCAIVGFSQGACLAVDHAARYPTKYGFIAAFTGGLIGPPGTEFAISGSLDRTPVFLGANDPDHHVPWSRVAESAAVLEGAGAEIDLRRYPGEPHAINSDELARTRELLTAMLERVD